MNKPVKTNNSLYLFASGPSRALLAILALSLALVVVACSQEASLQPVADADAANQVLAAAPDPPPAEPIQAAVPTAVPTDLPAAAPTDLPTAAPAALPTPAPAATPAVDLERVKPNELGTIPILEFHVIADAEEDQWTRTPENLRQDLQKLYDAGYRPISMADLLDDRIDLPSGTSPVLLTFDDSSPGQFRFLERGGRLLADPDSAVGILEAFHAAHPDFPLKATFYVLPEADQPHKLFGQPEHEAEKLRYLVDRGFEIGNHSYWHQRFDVVDDEEVQRQIALAIREIQKAVPGYPVRTLALPQGMWPEDRSLAIRGSFEGITYHNEAILLVGSEPAPSPYSRDYDPYALPRVQVFEDNLDWWLDYLEDNPDERYVSDGDPDAIAFPQRLEPQLNTTSVGNRQVRPY